MNKKTSVSFFGAFAVVIILIAAGLVLHFAMQKQIMGFQNTLPQNPFPYKGPTPVFGLLYSATNNSVTVTDQKSMQHVFAVTSETQIVSQVPAGQAGKALSQFSLNENIVVLPQPGRPDVAATVSETPKPLMPPPGVTISSFVGTFVSSTGSLVTLETNGSTTLAVRLSSTTTVVANTLTGKITPRLSAIGKGTELTVTGIAQTDGSVDAIQIQILIPLESAQSSQ